MSRKDPSRLLKFMFRNKESGIGSGIGRESGESFNFCYGRFKKKSETIVDEWGSIAPIKPLLIAPSGH
jgi:hypothetical protein